MPYPPVSRRTFLERPGEEKDDNEQLAILGTDANGLGPDILEAILKPRQDPEVKRARPEPFPIEWEEQRGNAGGLL